MLIIRTRLFVAVFIVGLIVTGCGSTVYIQATPPPPTFTPTPLSTPLPTVGTQVPLGAEGRAFHVALVSSDPNADGSSLAKYLTAQSGTAFQVDVLSTSAQVLSQLCSGTPTFAWLDGPGLLAAQAQGCGNPTLKFEQGTDKSTGVKADLITRAGAKGDVSTLAGFKGRDFCRLNGSNVTSWILPSLSLRAAGLNPAQDLKGIKEYADTATMLQAVADGTCVGAGIPSGTLSTFSPKLGTGQSLTVLQTTPELPFGGLVIASTVPTQIADDTVTLFSKYPDELHALLSADALDKVGANDYADFLKFAQNAGLNLKSLGQ